MVPGGAGGVRSVPRRWPFNLESRITNDWILTSEMNAKPVSVDTLFRGRIGCDP